jgi:hypothetical protein
MKSSGTCNHCKEAEAANTIPKSAAPIGEEVVVRTAMGRGHDQTAHFFSQYADCGSVWVTYVDGGVGGHGRFHRRLTKDLF